jgi:sensor histidine kinase YesM
MTRSGEWRLRPLLLLIFMAFNGLLLALATTIIYYYVSRMVTEQTTETRLQLLAESQQQLTRLFRDTEETALSILTHPVLLDALSQEGTDTYESIQQLRNINEVINPLLYSKAFISSIQVYSDRFKNTPHRQGNRVVPLSNIAWPAETGRLEHADSIWIGAHPDPSVQYHPQTVISYVSKVYTYNGKVGGYLEINVIEEFLFGMLANKRNRPGSTIIIADSGGRLISHTPSLPEGQSIEQLEREPWLAEILRKQDDGYTKEKISGTSYLINYSSPNHAQWRLLEIIPTAELYRPVDRIRNMVLGVGLLGILISIPAAFYLSRRIIRPIPELLTGFRKVQDGNFNTSVAENHNILEFRQLLQGFNRMTRQLDDLLERYRKEQRAKREAEFQALQSQINPHFLYNALDMINWMAAAKGAHDISMMTSKLARLFRISLSKGKAFIKLSDELEHCRLYVQIQQARYRNPFEFAVNVDREYQSFYVPKLILQPFIENAIIHGFSQLDRGREHPRIVIKAEAVRAAKLCIIVEDNGAGLPKDWETAYLNHDYGKPSADGSSGYGIKNVAERIQLYFGSGYGVTLSDRETGGVRVTITLPPINSEEELAKIVHAGGPDNGEGTLGR